MHPFVDVVGPTPTYQRAWTLGESVDGTRALPVVYVAAESRLRDEIQSGLLHLGVSITALSPRESTACQWDPNQPACTVIDLDGNDADICELLGTISGKDNPPVILVGTCDDARLPIRAVKSGAFDFFPKPLDSVEICAAIMLAMAQDRRQITRRLQERELRSRMDSLTRREREVLPLVIGGLLNKQAAALLGISEITLQIHRGQVMRKMQAASLADLVRMCMRLRVRHWQATA